FPNTQWLCLGLRGERRGGRFDAVGSSGPFFHQVGTCSALRVFSLERWDGSDRVEPPEAVEAGSCAGWERCVGNANIVVRVGDPGVACQGLVADLGCFIACIDWEAHPPAPAPA